MHRGGIRIRPEHESERLTTCVVTPGIEMEQLLKAVVARAYQRVTDIYRIRVCLGTNDYN
jgi:hypothetical protein